ncbi:MAG: hypothetical protein ACYTBP_09160 [Planctomycetota bacterium]
MMRIISKVILSLVLVSALNLAGCQQGSEPVVEKADPLQGGADISTVVLPYGFAASAIAAVGGYEAWANTQKAELDAVVTIYSRDGSHYLTEQQYEVYPWAESIVVTAPEPSGNIVWRLNGGNYTVVAGAKKISGLDMGLSKRDFAETVRDVTISAVRLLDKSYRFVESSGPVKAEGKWYIPITRHAVSAAEGVEKADSRWSNVIFYQRKNGSKIDMIWYADEVTNQYFMVRGYDYRKLGSGASVPGKIEIYSTNAKGVSQERLLKIDMK